MCLLRLRFLPLLHVLIWVMPLGVATASVFEAPFPSSALTADVEGGVATELQFSELQKQANLQLQSDRKLQEFFNNTFSSTGVQGELKDGTIAQNWEKTAQSMGISMSVLVLAYLSWKNKRKRSMEAILSGEGEKIDDWLNKYFDKKKTSTQLHSTVGVTKDGKLLDSLQTWEQFSTEKGFPGAASQLQSLFIKWRQRFEYQSKLGVVSDSEALSDPIWQEYADHIKAGNPHIDQVVERQQKAQEVRLTQSYEAKIQALESPIPPRINKEVLAYKAFEHSIKEKDQFVYQLESSIKGIERQKQSVAVSLRNLTNAKANYVRVYGGFLSEYKKKEWEKNYLTQKLKTFDQTYSEKVAKRNEAYQVYRNENTNYHLAASGFYRPMRSMSRTIKWTDHLAYQARYKLSYTKSRLQIAISQKAHPSYIRSLQSQVRQYEGAMNFKSRYGSQGIIRLQGELGRFQSLMQKHSMYLQGIANYERRIKYYQTLNKTYPGRYTTSIHHSQNFITKFKSDLTTTERALDESRSKLTQYGIADLARMTPSVSLDTFFKSSKSMIASNKKKFDRYKTYSNAAQAVSTMSRDRYQDNIKLSQANSWIRANTNRYQSIDKRIKQYHSQISNYLSQVGALNTKVRTIEVKIGALQEEKKLIQKKQSSFTPAYHIYQNKFKEYEKEKEVYDRAVKKRQTEYHEKVTQSFRAIEKKAEAFTIWNNSREEKTIFSSVAAVTSSWSQFYWAVRSKLQAIGIALDYTKVRAYFLNFNTLKTLNQQWSRNVAQFSENIGVQHRTNEATKEALFQKSLVEGESWNGNYDSLDMKTDLKEKFPSITPKSYQPQIQVLLQQKQDLLNAQNKLKALRSKVESYIGSFSRFWKKLNPSVRRYWSYSRWRQEYMAAHREYRTAHAQFGTPNNTKINQIDAQIRSLQALHRNEQNRAHRINTEVHRKRTAYEKQRKQAIGQRMREQFYKQLNQAGENSAYFRSLSIKIDKLKSDSNEIKTLENTLRNTNPFTAKLRLLENKLSVPNAYTREEFFAKTRARQPRIYTINLHDMWRKRRNIGWNNSLDHLEQHASNYARSYRHSTNLRTVSTLKGIYNRVVNYKLQIYGGWQQYYRKHPLIESYQRNEYQKELNVLRQAEQQWKTAHQNRLKQLQKEKAETTQELVQAREWLGQNTEEQQVNEYTQTVIKNEKILQARLFKGEDVFGTQKGEQQLAKVLESLRLTQLTTQAKVNVEQNKALTYNYAMARDKLTAQYMGTVSHFERQVQSNATPAGQRKINAYYEEQSRQYKKKMSDLEQSLSAIHGERFGRTKVLAGLDPKNNPNWNPSVTPEKVKILGEADIRGAIDRYRKGRQQQGLARNDLEGKTLELQKKVQREVKVFSSIAGSPKEPAGRWVEGVFKSVDPTKPEWGNVELWIRDFGPIDAQSFDQDEIFGHAMVKVNQKFYGMAPRPDELYSDDVQVLTGKEFTEGYTGQKWNRIEIRASENQAKQVVAHYLKQSSEKSIYRVQTNNCSQNLEAALVRAGIIKDNPFIESNLTVVTPSLLTLNLNLKNISSRIQTGEDLVRIKRVKVGSESLIQNK